MTDFQIEIPNEFIYEIDQVIERLTELESPYSEPIEDEQLEKKYMWTFSKDKVMEPFVKFLIEKAKSGDPLYQYFLGQFYFGLLNADLETDEQLDEAPYFKSWSYWPEFDGHPHSNDAIYFYQYVEDKEIAGRYHLFSQKPDPFCWLKKSAEKGFTPAVWWMGMCTEEGFSIEKNKTESQMWLREAEKLGPVDYPFYSNMNFFKKRLMELLNEGDAADQQEDWLAVFGYNEMSQDEADKAMKEERGKWRLYEEILGFLYPFGQTLGLYRIGEENTYAVSLGDSYKRSYHWTNDVGMKKCLKWAEKYGLLHNFKKINKKRSS